MRTASRNALCMARAEWHACCSETKFILETPLHPDFSDISFENVGRGSFQVGGGSGFAYDNELPERHVELDDFSISSNPISNARYLAFILDGGYDKREWWSVAGWDWRMKNGVNHPARWRQDDDGDWFEITFNGADHLSGDSPVCGVTRYEAGAFASWAKARLPHEFEWETALRAGLLYKTGQVWEWCAIPFTLIPGFGHILTGNILSHGLINATSCLKVVACIAKKKSNARLFATII